MKVYGKLCKKLFKKIQFILQKKYPNKMSVVYKKEVKVEW